MMIFNARRIKISFNAARARQAFAVIISIAASSCAVPGEEVIELGRDRYVDAIQRSRDRQLLRNMVWSSQYRGNAFVDVNSIQTSLTVNGSAGATGSNLGIGAPFAGLSTLFGATSGPTVSFAPLRGSELVDQMIRPISPLSMVSLIDSNWKVPSVLQMVVDNFSQYYARYGSTLNSIMELRQLGALLIHVENVKSEKDVIPTLTFSLRPFVSRGALGPTARPQSDDVPRILFFWCRLAAVLGKREQACALNDSLAAQALQSGSKIRIDFLRLRSALGVLTFGTLQPRPLFSFVSSEDFERILRYPWNSPSVRRACDDGISFLTILPSDEALGDMPPPLAGTMASTEFSQESERFKNQGNEVERYIRESGEECLMSAFRGPRRQAASAAIRTHPLNEDAVYLDARLASLRRYILIVKNKEAPRSSAVSFSDGENWYYIDNRDEVSKSNFALLNIILTVQAVESRNTGPVLTLPLPSAAIR